MIDSKRPPIFVVGPPRTGTTLLARILRRHPEVFFGGEAHFFEDIYGRRRQLGEPSSPDAKNVVLSRLETLYGRFDEPAAQRTIDRLLARQANRERLRAAGTYRDIFDEWMSLQAEAAGKTRWGNHCPRDLFHLEEVRALFPEAKLILCVRDVRGFLASYKHQWRTCAHGADRKRKLYHPIVTSLLWRACIGRVRTARDLFAADRSLIVRYERLVGTPEATVRGVCEFLDVPFDANLLALEGSNSSFAEESEEEGIFTSSVGRWREEISREEIYIAEKVAGHFLAELDYVAERPRPNPFRVGALLASFPIATLRALHAGRTTRGPLLPYLRQRVAALRSAG